MGLEEREWPLLGGYNVEMGMVGGSDGMELFEVKKEAVILAE